jgi:TolB protein
MDADGSNVEQLTFDRSVDLAASFRPDGSLIAWFSGRSGNLDIWVMEPDGRKPRQLTHHPGRDWSPAWSPDGMRIAYFSDRADGHGDIWVMELGFSF